jgi:hypothetical protein
MAGRASAVEPGYPGAQTTIVAGAAAHAEEGRRSRGTTTPTNLEAVFIALW